MKKNFRLNDISVIILVFLFSRLVMLFLDIRMSIRPLYIYWQYLDVETLKHHVLAGVWFDHAQPPVFNLFLGAMLKCFGESALAFGVVFKIVSLCNGLLLYSLTRKFTQISKLPLLFTLLYLLSPATLIFECELFYTTFVSLLLLTTVYFIFRFHANTSLANLIGIFLPMVLLCLMRSVYHILWLLVIVFVLLIYYRKTGFTRMLPVALLSLLLVGGWYAKNKFIFGKFTLSTWMGMNLARNVFHDQEIRDSGRIEAYGTFSRIGEYKKFIDPEYEKKYRGLNDRDLLEEFKNDSFMNENNVNYIPVSALFEKAAIAHIKADPVAYLKNVLQSAILFFAPATTYSLAEKQAEKIKYFDIVYSFNLTRFAHSRQARRIALVLSAIPKLLTYLLVFWVIIRKTVREKSISSWNLFILLTLGFVFVISSFLEHYENMRFRFETEPLFLILAAQAINLIDSSVPFRKQTQTTGRLTNDENKKS